jgi:hippurate hydrolase
MRMTWMSGLQHEAEALVPSVIELRRALHRIPELGNDLPETRALVLEALSDLDLRIEESELTTSFVATLKGGSPGRCLMLRADMDALPMPEDSGLDYASETPGRMHACGHDAHTAMLVGAARLLAAHADSLAGDVKFFFQTGEEGHFGAKICSEEGLLDRGREPDAAFALHIDPRMACGRVAGRSGALLASTTEWEIKIKGKGGHASMPHNAVDPIPAACEIVAAIQSMVTRRIDAFDPAVITTTQVHAGTTDNVIPEIARLSGTLRATSERSRSVAEEGIYRIAQGVAQAHAVDAEVSVASGYPVTHNEDSFTQFARGVVDRVLGEGSYTEMPSPLMGGEDFSYLLQRWPGAMFFLGMRDPAIQEPAPVHSNRMVLDESGMIHGMLVHAAMALSFLEDSDSDGSR